MTNQTNEQQTINLSGIVKSLDDSNNSTKITEAGIFDLCDALSGLDNGKFTVEEAKSEMSRRGL